MLFLVLIGAKCIVMTRTCLNFTSRLPAAALSSCVDTEIATNCSIFIREVAGCRDPRDVRQRVVGPRGETRCRQPSNIYHSQKCVNKRLLSTSSDIVIRRHALNFLRTRDSSLKLSDPNCKKTTQSWLLYVPSPSLSHSSPYSFLFGASLPDISTRHALSNSRSPDCLS
jgi:hypothetical protein